jgi:hypothetical protein
MNFLLFLGMAPNLWIEHTTHGAIQPGPKNHWKFGSGMRVSRILENRPFWGSNS